MHTLLRLGFILFILAVLIHPEAAHAYGGPGSVISGIGALLAAVATLVAFLFGFVWFPLKRLIRKMRSRRMGDALAVDEAGH